MVSGAALLWGTLGLFGKLLFEVGLVPIELASVRAGVCFVGLAAWLLLRGHAAHGVGGHGADGARFRLRARDVPFFAFFGVVAIALFEWLYFAAVELVTLSLAASLLYTAPAFVIMYTRLAERTPIPHRHLMALAMVLSGVVLVTGALRTLGAVAVALPWLGILFGLLSGMTYAVYTLAGKHALQRYTPVEATFYAFGFGALALALLVPPWRPFIDYPTMWPAFLALGIFPTMVAYLLYVGSLRHLSAPAASMIATTEPVIATTIGFAALGETLFPEQGLGVLLIVSAAVLLARREREAGASPPS